MASVYFDPSVGGDGSTVTDDNNATTGLGAGGHRTRFVPALSQTVAVSAYTVAAANTAVNTLNTSISTVTTAASTATAAASTATTAANDAQTYAAAAWDGASCDGGTAGSTFGTTIDGGSA